MSVLPRGLALTEILERGGDDIEHVIAGLVERHVWGRHLLVPHLPPRRQACPRDRLVVDLELSLQMAAAGGAESEAAALQPEVPLAAPLPPAQVVRTGEPEFLTTRADVRDRFAELLAVMPDIGSVAMLPLNAGDEWLGVLGVSFADERAHSTADREYLAALGGISALTLARDRR